MSEFQAWLDSKPENCRAPRCKPSDAGEGLCCGWIEGVPMNDDRQNYIEGQAVAPTGFE